MVFEPPVGWVAPQRGEAQRDCTLADLYRVLGFAALNPTYIIANPDSKLWIVPTQRHQFGGKSGSRLFTKQLFAQLALRIDDKGHRQALATR